MAIISRRTVLAMGAAAPLATTAAWASTPFRGEYALSLGGFRLGMAEMQVVGGGGRYDAEARFSVSGLARLLFDGEGTASAEGDLDGKALTPARFETETRFGRDFYRIAMAFTPLPEVVAEPPLRQRRYDAPPEAALGALDPLSAAAALCLPIPRDAVADRVVALYDARRRADIVVGPVREADGELHAAAEIRRIAGFSPRHMAQPPVPLSLSWRLAGREAILRRAVLTTPLGSAVAVRRA